MYSGMWLMFLALAGLFASVFVMRRRRAAVHRHPEWVDSLDDMTWPPASPPAPCADSGFKLTAFPNLPEDVVLDGWSAEPEQPAARALRKRLTYPRRQPVTPALRRRTRSLGHSV